MLAVVLAVGKLDNGGLASNFCKNKNKTSAILAPQF
jgi:hypothetical protein